MATLMSRLDPAQYVPPALAKPLEKLRVPFAIPVYAHWIRLDMSSHEALFQETGHHDNWNHVEAWQVGGLVPMYQKFTSNVFGDANSMALKGHDTGPLVPHVSLAMPLNMLFPIHFLSSSCKWPISARRRLHRDRSLCAFAWVMAPYLYCSAKAKDENEEAPDGASKPSGLKAKAKSRAVSIGKFAKGEGVGVALLPLGGKTVFLPLSILDIILGALDLAINKAINKAFDKIWIVRGRDAKRHIKPFTKGAARKAGSPDAARYMRDVMVNKAWKDAAKSALTKWEVGTPFKLASYSFETDTVKVWTYSFGEWGPSTADPLRPLELLPEGPTEVPQPSSSASDPAEPDTLVCWPEDPKPAEEPHVESSEPEPGQRSPSSPSERPPRDSIQGGWLEPEPQEPLGPYDPGRTILDELLEGAPHAW